MRCCRLSLTATTQLPHELVETVCDGGPNAVIFFNFTPLRPRSEYSGTRGGWWGSGSIFTFLTSTLQWNVSDMIHGPREVHLFLFLVPSNLSQLFLIYFFSPFLKLSLSLLKLISPAFLKPSPFSSTNHRLSTHYTLSFHFFNCSPPPSSIALLPLPQAFSFPLVKLSFLSPWTITSSLLKPSPFHFSNFFLSTPQALSPPTFKPFPFPFSNRLCFLPNHLPFPQIIYPSLLKPSLFPFPFSKPLLFPSQTLFPPLLKPFHFPWTNPLLSLSQSISSSLVQSSAVRASNPLLSSPNLVHLSLSHPYTYTERRNFRTYISPLSWSTCHWIYCILIVDSTVCRDQGFSSGRFLCSRRGEISHGNI